MDFWVVDLLTVVVKHIKAPSGYFFTITVDKVFHEIANQSLVFAGSEVFQVEILIYNLIAICADYPPRLKPNIYKGSNSVIYKKVKNPVKLGIIESMCRAGVDQQIFTKYPGEKRYLNL